jgi:hypothetical protein
LVCSVKERGFEYEGFILESSSKGRADLMYR